MIPDNSCYIFFNFFPVVFWNYGNPMKGCEDKMRVEIVVFNFHRIR